MSCRQTHFDTHFEMSFGKRCCSALIGVWVGASVLVLNGCGLSPLLNHAPAPEEKNLSQQQMPGECPLRFDAQKFCASLSWEKMPTETEGGVMLLKFWEQSSADGGSVTKAPPGEPSVYLWMPDHGHGSSPVQLEPVAKPASEGGTSRSSVPGQYRVSEIFFIMPGVWDIHVQLKEGSVILGEAVLRHVAP